MTEQGEGGEGWTGFSCVQYLFLNKKINTKYLNCLFDPQTAGGFLFILDPTQKKILNELAKKKINYSSIGRVINSKKKIKVI